MITAAVLAAQPARSAVALVPAPRAYDLTLPPAVSVADPYNLSNTASANVNAPPPPPGTPAVPPSSSFAEFSHSIHGTLAAGIGTHGATDIEGAVSLPLIPGKLELEAGGGTTQLGGFAPSRSAAKPGTLRASGEYAILHIHPSEDLEISLGVSHTDLHIPTVRGGW